MQTQAAFSGGVLPMPSTWQWNQATPDKPGHFQIVVALCTPPVSALASDLGLLQAGWQTGTTRMVAHLLISAQHPDLKYSHILPRPEVDFVGLAVIPTGESLLAAAVAEGSRRASSDSLLLFTEGIFDLIGFKRLDQIELLLKSLDPAEVAPEISVAILRATCSYKHLLSSWTGCLEKTRRDLQKRGLPSDQVLIGLGGETEQRDKHT
jgi:hypothetical protein